MEQNKCKYAIDGKRTNPNTEAVECPTKTYDKDSLYSDCDCDCFENDSEFSQTINGGILNLAKVTEQLLKHDTNNCNITYKHGNIEIVFNFFIAKITQDGKVVYDTEEEGET